MRKEDCYYLGYIAKVHGYKGDVSFFLDVTNPKEYQTLDAVFVEMNEGQLIPFFVENISINPHKNFAKVKLEDLDTEEEAKALVRKGLYLPIQALPELSGKNFYDHEVIGFKMIDENFGEVGIITRILDYAQNPLFELDKDGQEVLFPLNQEFIVSLDREKKEILVAGPEGYFEIFQ